MDIHQPVRRLIRPLLLGLALTATPAAVAATAPTASATTCATPWGSTAEKSAHTTTKQITDVRSGRHACYDRLVITVNGDGTGKAGYQVKYVRHVVRDGSGTHVRLRGAASLRIVIKAPAYDPQSGDATYAPAHPRNLVDVSGYDTFRQVAWAGSFEGWTMLGLGVRARLPMRVFVINDAGGARRIVVDVAHSWE